MPPIKTISKCLQCHEKVLIVKTKNGCSVLVDYTPVNFWVYDNLSYSYTRGFRAHQKTCEAKARWRK